MLDRCNRCRRGTPEFAGIAFEAGKVFHIYRCECGNTDKRFIDPYGYDLDDPRAVRAMLPTQDYMKRIGLDEKNWGWRPAHGNR